MFAYKETTVILNAINKKQGSIKSLVHRSKYKNKKELYALVCETLKYKPVIEEIMQSTKLLKTEKLLNNDPVLASVLLFDYLFGKGFDKKPGGNYKNAILRHKAALSSTLARIKVKRGVSNDAGLISEAAKDDLPVPKYVRVNTLKTSVSEVVEHFKRKGYTYYHQSYFTNYDRLIVALRSLSGKSFLSDIHIDNLLIFPKTTDFHEDALYKRGDIIIQDKASCMPAQILAPPPGSHVIDCCAAPGNKTSHAAALMKNKGKIFAFDLDSRRLATMNTMLLKAGVLCVETKNEDFLKVDLTAQKFKDVEYVIVDPSCSGSGIVSRLNYVTDDESSASYSRINKLANFQATVLNHVFTLPKVKVVCYSTCSIHERENEQVVGEVLERHGGNFKLERVLSNWINRGNDGFTDSDCCIRSSPESDLTNGFFVACFVRRGSDRDSHPDHSDTMTSQSDDLKREFDGEDGSPSKHVKMPIKTKTTVVRDVRDDVENCSISDSGNASALEQSCKNQLVSKSKKSKKKKKKSAKLPVIRIK